jgi:hypothetical protein
MAPNSA